MHRTGQPRNLKALTGLRFVAALLVFISHTFVWFPQVDDQKLPLGWAGVGFFYVLSGFILTWVYAPRLKSFTLRDFYLRRFARIWPLHVITTLVAIFWIKGLGDFIAQPNSWAKFLAHILLMQAWVPQAKWVFSLNAPAWSLSVEAFFYLLFPLLIRGGTKRLLWALAVVTTTTAITIVALDVLGDQMLSTNREALICANPFFRLFDFVIGMLCGLLCFRRFNSDQGQGLGLPVQLMAFLLCAMYFAMVMALIGDSGTDCNTLVMWLRSTAAAPLFAFLIYTFANSKSVLANFLSSGPMVYLGEISFAFYLIHQSILLSLRKLPLDQSHFAGCFLAAAGLLLSLVAAIVLHHVVESPTRIALIKMRQSAVRAEVFKDWFDSVGRGFQLRRIAVMLAMIGAAWGLLQQACVGGWSEAAIEQVVQASAAKFRGVRFDQDALLLGVVTKQLDGGMHQITMAWDLKENRRPIRFMHICDEKGKILKVVDSNRALFNQFVGDERVIDTVTLPAKDLKAAHHVAVGFFDPLRKQAPIFIDQQKIRATRLKVLEFR